MGEALIRAYRGSDEAALIELWNATMTHDRVNESVFRTRVLLDANFSSDGLLVAEEDGGLVGFVLSIARQVPLFLQGLEPDLGWITAFGVHPERRRRGIAHRLFEQALGRLAGLGRRRLLISPYTPNYFIPGVDVAAYPEALAFLQATGWETVSTPISMRAEYTGLQIPAEILALERRLAAEEGITVRPVCAADLPALMPFIVRHFGWDWYWFAQEYLLQLLGPGSDEICFLVAARGDEIVGYCQQRRERFGPFGVDPALRGRGIGRVLLFRCLAAMLAQGFHCAWFLWTGEEAARLYALAGFRPVRRFAVMRRDIGA
ncbi:MAG: GNAT family N-acetyltransferase [Anaerolineae bacterium]|nr:GNAT family N-acetyltransferase [Anaerolineae bacterium]